MHFSPPQVRSALLPLATLPLSFTRLTPRSALLPPVQALFDLSNQEGHGLYKIHIVRSGKEAISALRPPTSLKPDLILLDIMMEEERGDIVLPKIRALYLESGSAPPKIVMSSILSHVERVQNLFDLGADGYLVKPIAPQTIKLLWRFVHPPDDDASRWLQQGVLADLPVAPPPLQRPSAAGTPPEESQRAHGNSEGSSTGVGQSVPPQQAHGARPAGAGRTNARRGHRPIHLGLEDDEEIGGCKQQ